MNNNMFAIALSPHTGKVMRVKPAGTAPLTEALELHRSWPRCDVYLCASPPAIATPADMDDAWCYWPEFDINLRRGYARAW